MKKYFTIFLFSLATIVHSKDNSFEPKLSDPNSFSIILLPDLQSYSKFDINHPLMDLMLLWSESQIEKLNVKALFCTGDLVEHNDYIVPDGVTGNQTGTEQWRAVSKSFEAIDNKIPYMISLGNHDYGYVAAENRDTKFNDYFPVERNSKWGESLVSVFNNAHGIPTLENAAFEMKTEHWGNLLIINTEFAPRNEVLTWVKELSESDRFVNHKVIFLTHSYLNGKGERIVKERYKLSSPNAGEAIWNKLIAPTANIRLAISGHYCNIGTFEQNVSLREDLNQAGKNVVQMMFNAQTADGEWFGNGGDGWLRILEFMPDGKSIKVKTYSPLFGISPTTMDKSRRTDSFDEFIITIE